MLPRRFYLSTALIALSVFQVPGAHAQSLTDTVITVLSSHPQIESSKVAIDTASKDIEEQRSGYFPEVSATATGGRIYGDNATSRGLSVTRGSGYSYLWEGSLTGRQMIWDAKETGSLLAAARTGAKAAKLDLVDIREQLAMQAVATYIDLMRARSGYAMVVKYRTQVEDYLSRIQDMVDEGAADEAELHQARDVLIFLQNFEADYKGQIGLAEADFIELTGHVPDGSKLSVPAVPADSIPLDIDKAVVLAENNHAAVMSASLGIEQALYGVDAERSAYYPDIDGELSYMKSDKADIIGGEVEDARALIKMNWNFATGGALSARVKKKNLEVEQAKVQLDQVRRQIERGVRAAYSEHETAAAQLANQKKRLDLNEKLFETHKTQFEGAVVSLLQLMQTDNQLFNARLETMNAQHRYVMAQYGILASIGQLQTALGISLDSASAMAQAQEKQPAHEQTSK